MPNFQQKIRRIWITFIGVIFVFFIFKLVSPFGTWTCSRNFNETGRNFLNRSCLGEPSPGERVAKGSAGPLLILADPVYLSVFTPRAFSRAEVTITYRPYLSSSTPIFEAGFLADQKLWRYRLQPIYNYWLENGFQDWTELSDRSLHLYSRNNRFTSVADFLFAWRRGDELCEGNNCLAVYNVDLKDFPPAIDLSELSQKAGSSEFPYKIRGAHQFYFYLNGNNLELSGQIFDRNENLEKDDAEILIFSGQSVVASVKIKDERPEKELSGDYSGAQAFKVSRSDLKAGLYRLEFRAGDDLSLDNLRVNSAYLSAINKVWTDGNGAVELLTDASYLQVKAIDPAVLQDLKFGNSTLKLGEIYKQYEIKSRPSGLQKIEAASGGLVLENNGVFAATASKLLNPDYRRLDRFAPSLEQLDYVIADYQAAEHLADDWLQTTVSFTASDLYREDGRYSLILSAPGLKLDSGAGGLLEIKEIKIRFSGKNLWDKVKEIIF